MGTVTVGTASQFESLLSILGSPEQTRQALLQLSEASKAAEDRLVAADKATAQAQAAAKAVTDRETAASRREDDCDAKEAYLAKWETKLAAAERDYQDRVTKLKAFIS